MIILTYFSYAWPKCILNHVCSGNAKGGIIFNASVKFRSALMPTHFYNYCRFYIDMNIESITFSVLIHNDFEFLWRCSWCWRLFVDAAWRVSTAFQWLSLQSVIENDEQQTWFLIKHAQMREQHQHMRKHAVIQASA